MRWGREILSVVLSFFLMSIFCVPAGGSKYTPEGLYDVEIYTMKNGMRVILSPREGVHNVAIRLVAGVGTLDFRHGKREVPHFLEHLLFAGTKKHTEEELERLVQSRGGRWNASTGRYETVIDMDIYSGNLSFGLGIIFEIITGSTFTPEKVEVTRELLYREMGGKPSKIRRWLYRKGVGKSAFERAVEALYPDEKHSHPFIETAENISREEIVEAFEKYYVPANMTIIVVGEFDRDWIVKNLQYTFGTLKGGKARVPAQSPPPYPEESVNVTGTFSPIVGSDALAALAFRTEGTLSKDYHALLLLSRYLDMKLYERLRVREGLAYGPSSQFAPEERYGSFFLYADVNMKDMERAADGMWGIIEEVKRGEIDKKELSKTKRGLLLSISQAYQTNGARADYYSQSLPEVEAYGSFVDDEAAIEKVGSQDLVKVAKKYFRKDRAVTLMSEPTITYTSLYNILASIVILVILWIFILYLRRRKRKRRPRGLALPI